MTYMYTEFIEVLRVRNALLGEIHECTIVFSRSYKFGFIIMRFLMRLDTVREVECECFQLLALAVDAIHLERSRSVANDFLKRCPTHARKSVCLKLSSMNMNSLRGERE